MAIATPGIASEYHNTKHMDIILELIKNQPWFGVVTAVIALASAIAAITPTPKAGTWQAKVYGVIDFLALNVLKAKDTGSDKKQ